MQATVRSFDEQRRCGEVLLDDGSLLGFDAAAFDASGLRCLRLGQRVRLRTAADGHVTFVTLATFRD